MYKVLISALLFLPAGCATVPADFPSVLIGPSYTLAFRENCQEGDVGCDHLSGTLTAKGNKRSVRLTGSTYMVKCADGVTPCHVGYYDLAGSGFSVLAYPDGTLDVTAPASPPLSEKGNWLDY